MSTRVLPPLLLGPLLAGTLLLSSCTGDEEAAGPAPTISASQPEDTPVERDVRTVLEGVGVTAIGAVKTPRRGEAFMYGQIGDNRSMVVHSVREGGLAPGEETDRIEMGPVVVRVVDTEQFGVVARFPCGDSTVDVWVRRGNQGLSRDGDWALRQARAYMREAGCLEN